MLVLRNFYSIIRRYKLAFFLNVVGLCVALVVAALIGMQLRYDLTFDPAEPEKENICLLGLDFGQNNLGKFALAPRPLEDLVRANASVRATCLMSPMPSPEFIRLQQADGRATTAFREQTLDVSRTFTDVFTLEFVENVPELLSAPGTALVPENVAKKLAPDASALGMTIELDGTGAAYTITGVYKDLAPNSTLSNYVYLRLNDGRDRGMWGNFNYNLFALLEPGADRETLAADVQEAYLAAIGDEDYRAIIRQGGNIVSLTDIASLHFSKEHLLFDSFPKADPARLLIFLAIAVLVIVIACINLVNFYTALAPLRVKSINTMKVLGSSRPRLCAGIIAESVMLSLLAWGLSLLCVFALKGSAVAGLIDPEVSVAGQMPVFLITLGAVLVAGMLSGIYPALYITSFQPALALKGSFALSPKGRKIRIALVGFQFFVSFALIVCVGVIFMQNKHMQGIDLGFEKDRLLTVALDGQVPHEQYDQFRRRVEVVPGVEKSAFASYVLSSSDNVMTWGRDVNGTPFNCGVVVVTDGFLETIGAGLLEGRDFSENDEFKWIFNDMARKAFGMTMDMKISSDEDIIGFVEDVRTASLRKSLSPMGFFIEGKGYSYHDTSDDVAYIRVAEGNDFGRIKEAVADILQDMVPDYPFEVKSNDEVFEQTYASEQNATLMIALFCATAVIISMIGVFCLVMFDGESRRKEIAVRKVMGADTGTIVRSFIKTYLLILLVCYAAAAPVAIYFSNRWLHAFAERIAFPWWIFLIAFALVGAVTVLTVALQSWRAASENPIHNLKSE